MERAWVDWLQAKGFSHPWLECGIGDDASVHRLPDSMAVVVTTDLVCEGVHFQWHHDGPQRAGRKALAVNLSDLAAMAVQPVAAWVSLLLPRSGAGTLARAITEGMLPLAEQYQLALAGGDTNTWDGELAISVTAMGVTRGQPLLRSGAQPNDWILVTGRLGGSVSGWHLDFMPRVSEALTLRDRYQLHAGMDISDSLLMDLDRMARASGCGACLELAAVPVSAAAHRQAAITGRTPRDHALEDGEDFELLLAVPPDEGRRLLADQPLAIPLTRVGHMMAGDGLWAQDEAHGMRPLAVRGFEHRDQRS